MTERRCACGCGRSLDGMRKDAIWSSRACAVRWARSNPGKSLHDAQKIGPAVQVVRRCRVCARPLWRKGAMWCSDACRMFAHRLEGNQEAIDFSLILRRRQPLLAFLLARAA